MLYIDDTPMVRPYTGVIGPALTRLVSLEKLDIWMYLLPNTERLDYHHLETDEWQRLPIILGTQGSFPKLRTVSICLHAKLWDPYDHLEAEDQPEEERAAQAQDTESYAQSLVETMARITYPQSAFQGLLELRPKLGLSFVTKVTVRALAAGRTWERRVH
ncbi:hypothetical protein NMY22_g14315 [Coprinellus aureogranulatus]|nr:hypothetical protein NMY22_g14315 [Coprinellus aureogranulatus]